MNVESVFEYGSSFVAVSFMEVSIVLSRSEIEYEILCVTKLTVR